MSGFLAGAGVFMAGTIVGFVLAKAGQQLDTDD